MTINFLESNIGIVSDGNLPHNAQFNNSAPSRASWKYLYYPKNIGDFQNSIIQILGTTYDTYPGQGLQRVLPALHPAYPGMYASQISTTLSRGTGTDANFVTVNAGQSPSGFSIPLAVGTPVANSFVQPLAQEYTVDFSTYNYTILDNSQITLQYGSWYKPGTTGPLSPTSFQYYNEYDRFLEIQLKPLADAVSLNGGTVYFQQSGTTSQRQFQQTIYQYLPDMQMRMVWHGIPISYLKNPAWTKYIGYINQNYYAAPSFSPPTYGNFPANSSVAFSTLPVFPAGSLLYLGYTYVRQTQARYPATGETAMFPTLIDVEFNFLYTNRTIDPTNVLQVPWPVPYPSADMCYNNIVSGWNLLPDRITGLFLYATSPSISFVGPLPPASFISQPCFRSFAMESLFTDWRNTYNNMPGNGF